MDRESRFPIRKFECLEAMKDEEISILQSRPARERIAAVSEDNHRSLPAERPRHQCIKTSKNSCRGSIGHKVNTLVGGYLPFSFHAQPRASKDLDILIKADVANARRFMHPWRHLAHPLPRPTPEDFIEPGKFYRMGTRS